MDILNNKAVLLGSAVIAFLIAAVLVIMIFRMLFGGRLRMPGGRARQARLGIVDAFDLDRQRQLIIVRRDNTEHLIMIGGPNDLVIESEIIRAEAREPQRREPGLSPVVPEARIPAPPPALDGPPPVAPSRLAEEPLLPMPLPATPVEPRVDAGPIPPRPPTFPLPPRRPAPVQPEPRRPAPQLPDSVSRAEAQPATPPAPSFAPAPEAPILAPPPAVPPPSAAPAPQGGAPSPEAPKRPPFLKPLTPRPPMRPLQRTTPQAPPLTPPPDASRPPPSPSQGAPTPALPPKPAAPPQPAARPPVQAAPPPKPRPPAPPVSAPPPPQEESKDALESLEEEMAKLLGRGS